MAGLSSSRSSSSGQSFFPLQPLEMNVEEAGETVCVDQSWRSVCVVRLTLAGSSCPRIVLLVLIADIASDSSTAASGYTYVLWHT